jgi:hypothetical protein
MEPHFSKPPGQAPGSIFPSLPIVTPDPPRRSERDKYGGLFYLGAIGLAILVALVGWFAWGAWSHRVVWTNIYILHDRHRPEAERVQAAYALSRDPRVNQRQYWDICLRTPLPGLARYLVAEALTAEAVSADPRGYALTVARSPGWPIWLRLLLTRPLAYAAAQGLAIPAAPLGELRDRGDDPATVLWADFALALASSAPADRADAVKGLTGAAEGDGPERALARTLLDALKAEGPERMRRLDEATLWLRLHHPEAARLWSGWRIEGDRLVPRPAPKSP